MTNNNMETDLEQLRIKLSEVQQAMQLLEAENAALKKEWSLAAKKLDTMTTHVHTTYQQCIKIMESAVEERITILNKFRLALMVYYLSSPFAILKSFLQPYLTTSDHYAPKPLHIPKHYSNKLSLTEYPTISIVTPSFNQANFIERTILSVINQDYPNLEYVIQDGGSDDDTLSIVEKYKHRLKHFESAKDSGQGNAINLGFRHTQGEIMAYLNSDDILLPGTLAYVAKFFNEHPEIDVVYGHRIIIDEYDFDVGRWVLPNHQSDILNWADYIPQETLFWRRQLWDKTGGIDENFTFALDWDLLLRFKEKQANFARLPRFLGAFRVHSAQKTFVSISTIGGQEMDRLRIRCHGRKVSMREIKKNVLKYKLEHIFLDRLYKLGLIKY